MFKIDSLQVEGSVTFVPDVISDQARFSPTCSNPRSCDESQGATSPRFPMKADLHDQIEQIGSPDAIAFIQKFLDLLKSLGFLKG